MGFTGQLGTQLSQLGFIELGMSGTPDTTAHHTLNLLDGAHSNLITPSVHSTMDLEDSFFLNQPYHVSAETSLTLLVPAGGTDPDFDYPTSIREAGLTDLATYHMAISNQSVTTLASFADQTGRVLEATADSTISLTSLAAHLDYVVEHDLDLTDVATADTSLDTTTDIALSYTLLFNRDSQPDAIVEPLDIEQLVGWEIAGDTCTYSPQGDLDAAPTLSHATLTLTWPYGSPTKTVVLRNPDFNNQENLGLTRINRESRGGTLIIYADTFWPKLKTLVIQVSALDSCNSDVALLQDFLTSSVGQEIGLLDHEGRQWRGIILNPNLQLTEQDKSGEQVSIQFEGELV